MLYDQTDSCTLQPAVPLRVAAAKGMGMCVGILVLLGLDYVGPLVGCAASLSFR
jgi:hypothetical protein